MRPEGSLQGRVIDLASPYEISTEVLIEKYAKGDESTLDEVLYRVSKALAEVESSSEVGYKNAEFLWELLTSGGLQRLIVSCRAVSKVGIEPLRQSVFWCRPKSSLILLLYQRARAPPRFILPLTHALHSSLYSPPCFAVLPETSSGNEKDL